MTLSEVTVGKKMELQEEQIKLRDVVEVRLVTDNENWNLSIKN